MITIIQTNLINYPSLVESINLAKEKLTPDLSNYAKGRMRTWIGCEAPLTDNQKFKKTYFDYNSKLWLLLEEFCINELNFKPEIALLHLGGADCSDPEENPQDGNGGECGIKEHRDAGYADYKAVGINISGKATFGYKCQYPTVSEWSPTKWQNLKAPIQNIEMKPGTSIIFNCKNPHFAQAGANRWCINAWRISNKRRKEFEEFQNNYEL